MLGIPVAKLRDVTEDDDLFVLVALFGYAKLDGGFHSNQINNDEVMKKLE